MTLYTVTVGKKRGSLADFFVRTQEDVEVMLRTLLDTEAAATAT
jgi:hypothetical protein